MFLFDESCFIAVWYPVHGSAVFFCPPVVSRELCAGWPLGRIIAGTDEGADTGEMCMCVCMCIYGDILQLHHGARARARVCVCVCVCVCVGFASWESSPTPHTWCTSNPL
jgi:hypothetical protein